LFENIPNFLLGVIEKTERPHFYLIQTSRDFSSTNMYYLQLDLQNIKSINILEFKVFIKISLLTFKENKNRK